MKKIFAMLLSAVLLASLAIPVAADTPTNEAKSTSEDTDAKITLELIRGMSSWDELVKTIVHTLIPKDGKIGLGDVNNDDDICWTLATGINMAFDKVSNGILTEIDDSYLFPREWIIDESSLIEKLQAIVEVFNQSNNIYLACDYEINTDNNVLIFRTLSINAIEMDFPAGYVGEKVAVKNGTTYWESPIYDGVRKYGIASPKENPNIPKNYVVYVNGYVYYKTEARDDILESYYVPYEDLGSQNKEFTPDVPCMIHICTEKADLGWVWPGDVVSLGALGINLED